MNQKDKWRYKSLLEGCRYGGTQQNQWENYDKFQFQFFQSEDFEAFDDALHDEFLEKIQELGKLVSAAYWELKSDSESDNNYRGQVEYEVDRLVDLIDSLPDD